MGQTAMILHLELVSILYPLTIPNYNYYRAS